MIQNNYTLRKRQFRNLSNQINGLMKSRKWQKLTLEQQTRLTGRLHKLFGQIRSLFTKRELKKVLAGTAMLIGLAGSIQAQNFAAPVQNSFSLTPVINLAAPNLVDIDNDGDLDMFITEYASPPTLVYFSNDGTPNNPIFGEPVRNPFNLNTTSDDHIFSTFADIDGDGDFDILTLEGFMYMQMDFYYYENVGSSIAPDFANPQPNPFNLQGYTRVTIKPDFVDMDNDGDYDLLVGGRNAMAGGPGQLSYYENVGTAITPDFGSIQASPFGLGMPNNFAYPVAINLDNDGDFDVLVGEYNGGFKYFENIGTDTAPAFSAGQLNPFGLTSVYFSGCITSGDIDADGDLDLFVGEVYGDVQFFENLEIEVTVEDPEAEAALQIFPNPASKQVTVQFDDLQGESQLSIINELGMIVRQATLTNQQKTLDVQDLPSGFYMVELKTEKEQFIKKIVIQ